MRRSTAEAVRRARAEAGPRPGVQRLWAVRLDPPVEGIWATTPEAGGTAELFAVARTLYGMDRRFSVSASDDPALVLVRTGPTELLVVEEDDMAPLMSAVRRTGAHGTYRKTGTDKEYGF